MYRNSICLAVGLGCLGMVAQALACVPQIPTDSAPNSATPPEAPTQTLPIVIAPLLPPLTQAAGQSLEAEVLTGMYTWFALAGLDKVPAPPSYSEALQDYRAAWSAIHADVANFLGYWHNDEGYPYSLSVFPSFTPGQLCILEFQPEWSLDILNEETGETVKDVISPEILSFSVATVEQGMLRSSQVRSQGSAMLVTRYAGGEAYSVVLWAVEDGRNRCSSAISKGAEVLSVGGCRASSRK
ncbi:hypothetical protein [Leptothoe sp. PORK10 BA2]|uniref:hypothetical protein n=1 Tax=Leptothoe sp. PORK10 BA2 TaxID=3110254 RepID=UPI002B20D65C|nr:hypothetical protein [Leptothoe sp. PORK10 BA2]MEA5467156.1 hypothetical protein [Leptothoe sp. PORK10 BA2]